MLIIYLSIIIIYPRIHADILSHLHLCHNIMEHKKIDIYLKKVIEVKTDYDDDDDMMIMMLMMLMN